MFALLLAERGVEVIGIDPARASIDVARAKPGGDRVRWICGDATALPPLRVDLVTMTANVAQAISDPWLWQKTLRVAYASLRPGGCLVFESRDPVAGHVLTSESTLRFRERSEIEGGLSSQGFVVDDIRDAPDRPGKEFVFLVQRPEAG